MVYPNLCAEMARHGLTGTDLAKSMGVSPRTVTNWLNGSTDIKFETCKAIKDKHFPLLTVDYLFDDVPKAV